MVTHNVSALRRVRKSDNNRIALAVGATIVNRIEDLREADIGTKCGLFNIEKIGDECVSVMFLCGDSPLTSPSDTSLSSLSATAQRPAQFYYVGHPRTS